jgi:hypothetical protein
VDEDSFLKLAENAENCIVKRLGDFVKLKLKTSRRLYTLRVEKDRAEEILRKLKCKTIEA